MFHFSVVFLALLATSAAQPGFPRYFQGRWFFTNQISDYLNPKADSSAAEERVLPERQPEILSEVVEVVTPQAPKSLTTSASNDINDQVSDKEESAVWKIVLVVGVLLVSLVGSVSMAYYLCVWRGGRIYYQPQKEIYA